MKKIKIRQLFIIMALVLVIYPSLPVQAKVQSFSSLNTEITVPDNTIVLTKDTPDTDEQWNQAGISDPKSEKDTFDKMGVEAIFYDPDTKSTVRLLQNQSSESSEAFNLSLLSEEELNDFMNGLISSSNESTTYTVEKYSQSETPFFRVYIVMNTTDVLATEVIYGTVVNGEVISFDIFKENSLDPIDESYIKELVAGTHFTKLLDKTEVEKQGQRNTVVLVVSALILIGMVILLIILASRKNKKQDLAKKKKSSQMAQFFKEQSQREEQNLKETVLFLNRTLYTEEVVKQFCYYNIFNKHLVRWIVAVVFYILLLFSFYGSKYALISYIIAIIFLFFMIYFQGIQIEKTIKRLMKTYEKNKSMEAIFNFYEDYYTLSGIQSSSKYPYIQVSEIKEFKDYLYLYLGEDRALYLKKDGFEQGYEEFKKFILQKVNVK